MLRTLITLIWRKCTNWKSLPFQISELCLTKLWHTKQQNSKKNLNICVTVLLICIWKQLLCGLNEGILNSIIMQTCGYKKAFFICRKYWSFQFFQILQPNTLIRFIEDMKWEIYFQKVLTKDRYDHLPVTYKKLSYITMTPRE